MQRILIFACTSQCSYPDKVLTTAIVVQLPAELSYLDDSCSILATSLIWGTFEKAVYNHFGQEKLGFAEFVDLNGKVSVDALGVTIKDNPDFN